MRSTDTTASAERVQLALLRRATVARRATLARSLSSTTIQLSRRAIRDANPSASADELAVRFADVCYGPALADRLRRYLHARQAKQES